MKSSYRECQWNIVVHLGAGYHSPKLKHEYESLLKEVCEIGGKILALGGEAVEAIQACISILEDSPLTNAGRGSNLTEDGKVECDVSAIQSYFPTYINLEREHLTVSGSVGCLSDFKNPIKVAVSILRESNKIDPIFGREPPM